MTSSRLVKDMESTEAAKGIVHKARVIALNNNDAAWGLLCRIETRIKELQVNMRTTGLPLEIFK